MTDKDKIKVLKEDLVLYKRLLLDLSVASIGIMEEDGTGDELQDSIDYIYEQLNDNSRSGI